MAPKNNSGLSNNQNIQSTEVGGTKNYYDKLTNECKSKQSESCCLASVESMKAGSFVLASQEGCPVGYQPNMMLCVDSYRWCQPVENSPSNAQNPNTALILDFFVSGGLGSSFEVKISGADVTYRETRQGGGKEVEKTSRVLLPNELTEIQKTVMDAKLITLQSQDFTKEPLIPDQTYYRIFLSLDGKENTIHCGIIPSGTHPTTNCQKQIDTLRLKLNSILGVNIY